MEFLSRTSLGQSRSCPQLMPLSAPRERHSCRVASNYRQDGSFAYGRMSMDSPGLSLQDSSQTRAMSRLIEIAAVFARYSAKRVPTVLLLDWAAKSFDNRWMTRRWWSSVNRGNSFSNDYRAGHKWTGGHSMARVVTLLEARPSDRGPSSSL